MCGRYAFYLPVESLRDSFNLDRVCHYEGSYNISPTDEAPVVGSNPRTGKLSASLLTWGLIPHWAETPETFSGDLINARVETVDEKPSFRRSFRERRCIVPANGYYEWKQTDQGKTPHYVTPSNNNFIRLAGLWDTWTDNNGNSLSTFTVLTTEPTSKISNLHHRMPVILDPDQQDPWLDSNFTDVKELKTIALSNPNEDLEYSPVSQAVNDPSFDSSDCIRSTRVNERDSS